MICKLGKCLSQQEYIILYSYTVILLMVQKSQTTTWDGAKTRRK